MVGAKSVGCSTCRGRKVKCDERFPICGNCERGKRHCTGPKSRFIRFVEPGTEEHMNRDEHAATRLSFSLNSSSIELLAAEISARLSTKEVTGYHLNSFGNFYHFLPSRVGHNPALDASLRCILNIHRQVCSNKHNHHLKTEEFRSYNQALSLIRNDLDTLQSRTPSETLCAVLILSAYESFRTGDGTGKAWIAHAGGASALIEAWGPDRIVSDFDLTLFAQHYGTIIVSSLISGKECFLMSPEWDAVRQRSMRRELDPKSPPLVERYAVDDSCGLVWLPTLLKSIRHAAEKQLCPPICEARQLKSRLSKNALILESYLRNPAMVLEVPALHTTIMPTQYMFSQPCIGFRCGMYWATTILANSILVGLGDDDPFLIQEMQSAADNICMLGEFFHSLKPLGVNNLPFIKAMAFGVSSPERQAQLVMEVKDLYEFFPNQMTDRTLGAHYGILTGTMSIQGGVLRCLK